MDKYHSIVFFRDILKRLLHFQPNLNNFEESNAYLKSCPFLSPTNDINFSEFLLLVNSSYILQIFFTNEIFVNLEDEYKSLLATDYKFYLPEMMMLKVDRTSMANSLEVRSPFVDHRLIEYVMSHDTNYFDKTNQKSLLKNYLSDDFSNDFINRRKMGFVFNLESFIFSNLDEIKQHLSENNQYLENNLDILRKLSKNKSRINAIRILKLIIFAEFTRL